MENRLERGTSIAQRGELRGGNKIGLITYPKNGRYVLLKSRMRENFKSCSVKGAMCSTRQLKRIYLDTGVWCRLDEPSQRVTEEAGAFFRILRMLNEEKGVITSSVVLDDEIDMIRGDEKTEDVHDFVESDEREDEF